MEYKTYKTVDEQIQHLKDNKKIIVDDEDRHYLEERNYISLINPYKVFFASGRNNEGRLIYKNQSNFKELLNIIKIDEDYSKRIYGLIGSFEKKFKNIIISEICSKYVNINDSYCLKYIDELYKFLLGTIEFPMFCENYRYVYVKQSGKIIRIEDTYSIGRKRDVMLHVYKIATNKNLDGTPLDDSDICKNKIIAHYIKKYQYVPLWIIPNALTLGELQTIFSMLDLECQKNITSKMENIDYKQATSEQIISFSGHLELIRKMRNVVNHYEPILPFLSNEMNTKKIEDSKIYTTLELLHKTFSEFMLDNKEIIINKNPINSKAIRILNMMYSDIGQ